MSAFADVGSLGPQRIWDGIVGRSVHGDRVTLSVLELDAGAVVPEHSHENEQLGVLVEGAVTFTIGAETRELAPGGTWCIAAHVPHSVVVGPDGALIVEVFAGSRRLARDRAGGAEARALAVDGPAWENRDRGMSSRFSNPDWWPTPPPKPPKAPSVAKLVFGTLIPALAVVGVVVGMSTFAGSGHRTKTTAAAPVVLGIGSAREDRRQRFRTA